MKHIWSVLCSKGIIDKNTNNISLIEIIEEIKATTEIQGTSEGSANINTVGQMPVDWITLWIRSNIDRPEKTKAKDSIVSPSGKIIMEKEYEIDLQNHKRMRATRRIPIPPTNDNGIFLFRVHVNGEKNRSWNIVGEIPLFVTIEKIEKDK